MQIKYTRLLSYIFTLSLASNVCAQNAEITKIDSVENRDLIVIQTIDGKVYQVDKNDLIKLEPKAPKVTEITESTEVTESVSKDKALNNINNKPNIQINVIGTDNSKIGPQTTTTDISNQLQEVKNSDNVKASNSDQKTSTKSEPIDENESSSNMPISENKTANSNNIPVIETTKDQKNIVDAPIEIIQPSKVNPNDAEPAEVDLKKVEANEADVNNMLVEDVLPKAVKYNLVKSNDFTLRGSFGYGTFTTISNLSTNYSFGFAIGYNISKKLNIEFEYIFSEYEDTYNYNNYGYDYADTLDQSDFNFILNYKAYNSHNFDFLLRGGLSYSYRYADNNYSGQSDDSNSFGMIFGIESDIRISKNTFLTGIIDYNLNLSDSGYNYIGSPVYLASGEDFVKFSFGAKFEF